MKNEVVDLVLQAGPLVKFILCVLATFSIISWAIILFKWRLFANAEKQNRIFSRALSGARDRKSLLAQTRGLELSPAANLYKAVHNETGPGGNIARVLRKHEVVEIQKLERYLNFLATTGSTTPFIGLFGTVWGIVHSFTGIGVRGSASLAVVAPGIAEALIATAFGLAAAIPAVIGYNYFLGRARRIATETESLSEDIEESIKNGSLQ